MNVFGYNESEEHFLLHFNDYGYLPEGEHIMTIGELRQSILVKGDESTYLWNEPWRRFLVDNLETLLQPLWLLDIETVYLDGSFCSNKERPGDIDAFFDYETTNTNRIEVIEELSGLAHELNSVMNYSHHVWNWWEQRPDSYGKQKSEMWHHFRCEIFPNCYGVYAYQTQEGEGLKFRDLFSKDRFGIEKGLIKIVKG